ncbi:MAG TPA: adenylate/guanylate cyclase domain-containing protein [Microvirga sp.]|nr:adenylate/guanylate cyclase domain-containing protein [Microvirga sp.]
MQCPSCKADLPEGNRFCEECGAPVPTACPSCGAPIRPGAKFCGKCGSTLRTETSSASAPAPRPPAAQPAPSLSSAERRQLTVMFCDLVGSTALSARMDPEDLREVIAAYHKCVADVVGRFEGFVAKYMGDGVLVYFGYPQAHEDDAERAVYAGLDLVDAVGRLGDTAEKLKIRIGISTGPVIVGDLIGRGAAQEQAVIGETPNLAARLQALAEPNAVIIGPSTRRLLGDLFEYRDLGTVPVKGFAEPIPAWQALRPSAVESRFEALRAGGPTSLVGREPELALLLERWSRATDGEGQVILLEGEPGIGKSRLVRALRERLAEARQAYVVLSHYCSPYHTTSAFYPVIGHLERAARFDRDDTAEAKLDKLEVLLSQAARDVREPTALLASLLAIPAAARYPPLNLTPQRQKQRTLEVLLEQLAGLAGQRPVLVVYEDVHWADPSTLELLGLLIERVQRLPVLILITFRPEFSPPWTGYAHVTRLSLARLTRRHASEIALRLTGDKALPIEVVEQIVKRTEGVPLFIEELTKAVLEVGPGGADAAGVVSAAPSPPLTIPVTLHASLVARLDRLGASAKEVAQIGAAIGREFSYELLAAVARRGDAELQHGLDRLAGAGLVFQRGAPPQASFLFKHTLVQDAAYGLLLRGRRQELHARIADALKAHFPEQIAAAPELLAHHYTQAGLVEEAVENWFQAGQLAIARSATAEAVAQLTKALELLATLPDSPVRRRQELDLQVALGGTLLTAKGYAAPETWRAYARARELCAEIGETPQLFPVLFGQSLAHVMRAEHIAALEVAEELLRLAQRQEDPVPVLIAHRVLGPTLFHLGQFAPAREHLEQVLTLYDPAQHRSLAFVWGQDPRVASLCMLSRTLYALGYPDQALARSREALAEARALGHLATVGFALMWTGVVSQLRRDPHAIHAGSEELMSLATEQGFPLWLAGTTIIDGWAQAAAGQEEAGLAQLRRGLTAWQATGTEGIMPYYLGLAADACGKAGRVDEALTFLTDALARVEQTAARWFEAELHRLRAEALLSRGEPRQAEAAFRQALAVARGQGAKLWELRAATGLARFWRDQGRRKEAIDLVAPIYSWFTEGFDTPDLQDAKALLEEICE